MPNRSTASRRDTRIQDAVSATLTINYDAVAARHFMKQSHGQESFASSCWASEQHAMFTTTDHKTVLKGHQIWKDGAHYVSRDECEDELAREATIYEHLGEHPQILRCFELAPLGCVRQFIEKHANEPLPMHSRLQMALDVVMGLDHLHSKGVQYCDMNCRNLFLFNGYRVKLGDFGASLLEGYDFPPTFCEPRYELPLRGRDFNDRPPMKRELFALRSAIFEIVAGRKKSSTAGEVLEALQQLAIGYRSPWKQSQAPISIQHYNGTTIHGHIILSRRIIIE
ncbi:hypothetical protein ACRALDRAFT_210943 [Sodiomyces alcalophilus JCM 7366]|uniref:uncharacterized protein n=1 Tax=Sodiomyces alcalophilus JCM 7366 TaxID=591952 RepID=UPI0039B47DAC